MLSSRQFLLMASAAALVAAAPAHAQRQSLADRVAALEIQANNTSANMELLNRLTQQENELRQLREQIELLQNEVEQPQAAQPRPVPGSGRPPGAPGDGRAGRGSTGPGTGGIGPGRAACTGRSLGLRLDRRACAARARRHRRDRPDRRRARRLQRRLRPAQGSTTTPIRRSCSPASSNSIRAGSMRPTRCTGWARATTSPRTTPWPRSSSVR